MKIQLAVYTAIDGYEWQVGEATYTRPTLNQYKKIIGRFPDPSVDNLPFGGIFSCNNNVVFYRYLVARRADSKGRDALYVVLGACPKEQARHIDFKSLFGLPEFSEPRRDFPHECSYNGRSSASPSVALSFDAPFHEGLTGADALSSLGALFGNAPDEQLSARIEGSYASPAITLRYTKGGVVARKPEGSAVPTSVRGGGTAAPRLAPSGSTGQESSALYPYLIAIVAFMLGCIAGYGVHDMIAPQAKPEVEAVQRAHVPEASAAPGAPQPGETKPAEGGTGAAPAATAPTAPQPTENEEPTATEKPGADSTEKHADIPSPVAPDAAEKGNAAPAPEKADDTAEEAEESHADGPCDQTKAGYLCPNCLLWCSNEKHSVCPRAECGGRVSFREANQTCVVCKRKEEKRKEQERLAEQERRKRQQQAEHAAAQHQAAVSPQGLHGHPSASPAAEEDMANFCPRCGGVCKIYSFRVCQVCKGKPFNKKRGRCKYCKGHGGISVEETCPDCGGTGLRNTAGEACAHSELEPASAAGEASAAALPDEPADKPEEKPQPGKEPDAAGHGAP